MKTETKTQDIKVLKALRKGSRAYLGLYGTAYARAKIRFDQLKNSTDGLYDTLVARGESIEAQAGVWMKENQNVATKRYTETATKIRSVMPTASNDRVEALEAEIATLNKGKANET